MRRLLLIPLLSALLLIATPPARSVVGGEDAPDGAYPWMTALLERGSQICGATLISSSWVLTAAHCVKGTPVARLSVAISREDLSNASDGEVIAVSEVRIHPDYDRTNANENDVALLALARPSVAAPIRLSGAGDDDLEADGAPVRVTGWGDQIGLLGFASTNRLQQADLNVVGDDPCSEDLDPASQVCAEGFLKDSCQGDSGGPLFAAKYGTWVQVGVVSYGLGCAVPEFPGVYAEVNAGSIRAWIATNTGV